MNDLVLLSSIQQLDPSLEHLSEKDLRGLSWENRELILIHGFASLGRSAVPEFIAKIKQDQSNRLIPSSSPTPKNIQASQRSTDSYHRVLAKVVATEIEAIHTDLVVAHPPLAAATIVARTAATNNPAFRPISPPEPPNSPDADSALDRAVAEAFAAVTTVPQGFLIGGDRSGVLAVASFLFIANTAAKRWGAAPARTPKRAAAAAMAAMARAASPFKPMSPSKTAKSPGLSSSTARRATLTSSSANSASSPSNKPIRTRNRASTIPAPTISSPVRPRRRISAPANMNVRRTSRTSTSSALDSRPPWNSDTDPNAIDDVIPDDAIQDPVDASFPDQLTKSPPLPPIDPEKELKAMRSRPSSSAGGSRAEAALRKELDALSIAYREVQIVGGSPPDARAAALSTARIIQLERQILMHTEALRDRRDVLAAVDAELDELAAAGNPSAQSAIKRLQAAFQAAGSAAEEAAANKWYWPNPSDMPDSDPSFTFTDLFPALEPKLLTVNPPPETAPSKAVLAELKEAKEAAAAAQAALDEVRAWKAQASKAVAELMAETGMDSQAVSQALAALASAPTSLHSRISS